MPENMNNMPSTSLRSGDTNTPHHFNAQGVLTPGPTPVSAIAAPSRAHTTTSSSTLLRGALSAEDPTIETILRELRSHPSSHHDFNNISKGIKKLEATKAELLRIVDALSSRCHELRQLKFQVIQQPIEGNDYYNMYHDVQAGLGPLLAAVRGLSDQVDEFMAGGLDVEDLEGEESDGEQEANDEEEHSEEDAEEGEGCLGQ